VTTDSDTQTLDGISDDPLEPAELREIRRILLDRRRAGWLYRTGWKWILGAATVATGVAWTADWVIRHLRFTP
jgi:hypothetical protein